PAWTHRHGAAGAGHRRGVGSARPGSARAGTHRGSGHIGRPAAAPLGRGVVGAAAGGAGADPARRPPPRPAAARGSPRPSRCALRRPADPRAVTAGAGGVRRVSTFIQGFDAVVVVYFVVLNSFYAVLLLCALPEIWEQSLLAEDEDLVRLQEVGAPPPISILAPAYNESATVKASVTAI